MVGFKSALKKKKNHHQVTGILLTTQLLLKLGPCTALKATLLETKGEKSVWSLYSVPAQKGTSLRGQQLCSLFLVLDFSSYPLNNTHKPGLRIWTRTRCSIPPLLPALLLPLWIFSEQWANFSRRTWKVNEKNLTSTKNKKRNHQNQKKKPPNPPDLH